MADNTYAKFLFPLGARESGTGFSPSPGGQIAPEGQPAILWGQGTPDGNRSPFKDVNKGSLYSAVNQTDDTAAVWQKVDEGGDNADWVRMFVENHALIDTNDLAASAGITVAQLATSAKSVIVVSSLIDISAADLEIVPLHAVAALTITEIGIVWEEATAGSGAAEGDVTVGTATGGAQIVAADAYDVSQASGAYQALAIVSGAVGAGGSVFVSHDVADSAAGTYRVVIKYDLD